MPPKPPNAPTPCVFRLPKEFDPHRHEQEHTPLLTDPVPEATDGLGGARAATAVATGLDPAAAGDAMVAAAEAVPF